MEGERMKILVCNENGRVLPYLDTIYNGFSLLEVEDEQGNNAITKGLAYVNGAFIEIEPELTELKEEALEQVKQEFVTRRDAVRWVTCSDGNTYGFDCLAEDRSNFMQAYTPLCVDKTGTTMYKVWLNETKKGVVVLTYEDMKKTYETVRNSQFGAYAWYEEMRSKINACSTLEELEAII